MAHLTHAAASLSQPAWVPAGTRSRGRAGVRHPGSASGMGYAGRNNPRWFPELSCSWPPPRTRAGGGQRSFFLTLKAWEHLDKALGRGRNVLSCICCRGRKYEHMALALPTGSVGFVT